MKKVVILLSVFALALSSCTSEKKPAEGEAAAQGEETKKPGKKIRTETDSLSYAVGVDLGMYLSNLKKQAPEVNISMVEAAIHDVLADRWTLDQNQAMAFLQDYFSVRMPAKKKAEGDAFLADVEKKTPNIQKTESGLMYDIIDPGSDVKATSLKDQVRVMYKGTLKDGTEFDSSYERGDTAQFPLNGVIPGWGEGLQLIGEGGKIKLWIPSDLGYGAHGGGPIGPNEPLIFEVELFNVIPAEE